MSEIERRVAPRKEVRISVLCRTGIRGQMGVIANISLTGAFLECPRLIVTPGAIVKLQFLLEQGEEPIEPTGRVVRVTNRGFAIEFLSVTKELRRLVESLKQSV